MDRRTFLPGLGAVLAAPLAAEAQRPEQVKRIGTLAPAGPPETEPTPFRLRLRAELQDALRGYGWIEGHNLIVERRYAAGRIEQLPELAAELVALKVDLVIAVNSTAARAAKKATGSIPIVALTDDPVGHGLVVSLARPGGNVTGLTTRSPDIAAKRLDLLLELLPRASRVAVLACPPNMTATANWAWPSTETGARALKLQLLPFSVQTRAEIEAALKEAARIRSDGLLVFDCGAFNLLDTAIFVAHRLPAMYYEERYVHAGGLMAYGANAFDLVRRAAWYVDRILRGAKPADLPIEQPTKFRLVINAKTAKALGLTIPPSLLLRADQVIE